MAFGHEVLLIKVIISTIFAIMRSSNKIAANSRIELHRFRAQIDGKKTNIHIRVRFLAVTLDLLDGKSSFG